MIKALNTWADLAKAGFRERGSAGKPEDFEAIGRFVLAVSNEIDGRLRKAIGLQSDTPTRSAISEPSVSTNTGLSDYYWHTVLIAAAIALVKSGTISKEKIARIRALEKTSNKAIKAYVDAVMQADENFSKLQQAATAETGKFVAALGTIEAATDLQLHEIPTRLRKKDRVSRKDVPRSRVRPVRSSGT